MAIPVGAAFSQVGEFSFILGVLARQLGLLSDAGWDALVAASIISIALNPSIYAWARRSTGRMLPLELARDERQPVDSRRCVLVGYGPVGRTVHRILRELEIETTVVDLNLDTIRRLQLEGTPAVYGDVLRPGTLEQAGITTAGSLILSAEVEDGPEMVRQARIANPGLRVLARCAHLSAAGALRRAGAIVVVGEAEVAVALAEASIAGNEAGLRALSAQRESLRGQLYGGEASRPS